MDRPEEVRDRGKAPIQFGEGDRPEEQVPGLVTRVARGGSMEAQDAGGESRCSVFQI